MPTSARTAAGAFAGAVVWTGLALALPRLPEVLRFSVAFLLVIGGPGFLIGRLLPPTIDRLSHAVLSLSAGLAFAPILAHLLGTAGVLHWYGWVAAAAAGAALARPRVRRPAPARGQAAACAAIASIAVVLGAAAYAGRMQTSGDAITLHGEYDTFDTTYYAAVSSAVSQRVPPLSPYHAGHPLTYSYYPQLVLGLTANYGEIPLLKLYFTYAWTAFLVLASTAAFTLAWTITASTRTAAIAALLFATGSDFSYLVGWFWRPDTYLWDHLIWSTNFFSPSAETLFFNTFTPSMAIVFTGLAAVVAADREARRGPAAVALLCFAALAGYKPFAFAVVLAGLGLATMLPRTPWTARWRYAAIAAGSLALALPFLYEVSTVYAESHSKLVLRAFVMPATVLDKLALYDPLRAFAARMGLDGTPAHLVVMAIGTLVFLVGGLGVRMLGVVELWRRLRAGAPEWRVLGCSVVAGMLIPFVVATEPYHQTLHFYQVALFLLPIFVAAALARLSGRRWAIAAAVTVALAVPSTAHFLYMKRTDHQRPMITAERGHAAAARYLSRLPLASTVVLHDRPEDPSLVAILSGRPVVLAWSRYVVGSNALVTAIRRFYQSGTGNPDAAIQLLDDARVTHVVEHGGRNDIHPLVLARLRLLFRYGDVALYEVIRE